MGRARGVVRVTIKSLLWVYAYVSVRMSARQAGVILLYHDISDRNGDPLTELVPPISRARFAGQLAHLRHFYRLVDLKDIQSATSVRRRGERFPVAITFDDDLGHHVSHALPELRAAKVPATFFLCGGFLDGPKDFWWQRLQRAFDGGVSMTNLIGEGNIHRLGQLMEAMSASDRDRVSDELARRAVPVPRVELLTAEGAEALPHIGFHTVRHDSLVGLDDNQLFLALREGRQGLSDIAGYPIDTIAYPHGHFDTRVVKATQQEHFSIGVTCVRHAVTPDADPLTLGRYTPPADAPIGDFAHGVVHTLLMAAS